MGMLRPTHNPELESPFIVDKINAILTSGPDSPQKNEYLLALKKAAAERRQENVEIFFHNLDEQTRRDLEDDEYHAQLLEQAEEAMRRAFAINNRVNSLAVFDEEDKAKLKGRSGSKVAQLAEFVDALSELERAIDQLEDLQARLFMTMSQVQRNYVQAFSDDFASAPVAVNVDGQECEIDITQHENYEDFIERAKNRATTTEQKEANMAKRDPRHPVLECRRDLAEKLRTAYQHENEIVREQLVAKKVNETVRFLSNDYLNDISIQNMLYDQFKRAYAAELALDNPNRLNTRGIFTLLRVALNSREYGLQQASYTNKLAEQSAVYTRTAISANQLKQLKDQRYNPLLLDRLFDVRNENDVLAQSVSSHEKQSQVVTALPKPKPGQKSQQTVEDDNDPKVRIKKAQQAQKKEQEIRQTDPVFVEAINEVISVYRANEAELKKQIQSGKSNPLRTDLKAVRSN